jgi:hypothetical protein
VDVKTQDRAFCCPGSCSGKILQSKCHQTDEERMIITLEGEQITKVVGIKPAKSRSPTNTTTTLSQGTGHLDKLPNYTKDALVD